MGQHRFLILVSINQQIWHINPHLPFPDFANTKRSYYIIFLFLVYNVLSCYVGMLATLAALSFHWKLGANARNMGGIPGAMPTQILFCSEIFLLRQLTTLPAHHIKR